MMTMSAFPALMAARLSFLVVGVAFVVMVISEGSHMSEGCGEWIGS